MGADPQTRDAPIPAWQPILLALIPVDPIGFCLFRRQKHALYTYCVTKTMLYAVGSAVIALLMCFHSQEPTEWTAGGHWANVDRKMARLMQSYKAMILVCLLIYLSAIYAALQFLFGRQLKNEREIELSA